MKFDLTIEASTIINDVSTIDNIGQFSIAIGNLIKGDSGKSPYIDDTTKTWWEYNDTTKEYEDTGIAAKSVDIYNITNEIPLGAGLFYTLSTAITATPIANRKKGLLLMFESGAGVWETYQFKGVIANWSVLGSWSNDLSLKIDKDSIKQTLGTSTTDIMSQKAVTDKLDLKAAHGYDAEETPKTLKQVDSKDNIYIDGYVCTTHKFMSNVNSTCIVRAVIANKKYMINALTGENLSYKYYLFTEDINGQIPIGVRSAYLIGNNIITAPEGANYLFVCIIFNNVGLLANYDVKDNDLFLETQLTKLTADISTNKTTLDAFVKTKNIYDYRNVDVVTGVITTSGVLHTAGFSTGLIPIKPNHFYYLSNRNINAIRSIRCIAGDRITKTKVRVASTGEEAGNLYYYLPSEDGLGSASNSQFKTSPAAAYIQISLTTINATEIGEDYKIMLEDVGDTYNPDFIPFDYIEHKLTIKDSELEYPTLPLIRRVEDLENNPINLKVLLIGSSHGMNTIGQFPILAYNSGVNVVCSNAYQGSLSLEQVAGYCSGGAVFSGWYKKFINGVWQDESGKTILQMLHDEEWDFISIQRSASEDMTWTNNQATYFEEILSFISANCNYNPTIVFNSGFADSYSLATRETQQADTETIWTTAQNVKTNYGIEILPMAKVLQELRNNDTLANSGSHRNKMLACDSQHLDQGIGMYASGCIAFNFFLSHFRKSILTCNYIPTIADITPFWYEESKYTAIDSASALLIRTIVSKYFANN